MSSFDRVWVRRKRAWRLAAKASADPFFTLWVIGADATRSRAPRTAEHVDESASADCPLSQPKRRSICHNTVHGWRGSRHTKMSSRTTGAIA